MTYDAILMMFLVIALLWGGFAFALRTAMQKEQQK